MPLKGFIDPVTRNKVHAAHFDVVGGRVAPWIPRAAMEGQRNDVRHSGLDVTATRLTGCPRATYLETQFDYWVEPNKFYDRLKGTGMHSVMLDALDPATWITERNDKVRAILTGKLFGIDITMQMDACRRNMLEIIDGKFPRDWSVSYRKPRAKVEHEVQLNIARLLMAQQQWARDAGYDPAKVKLTLWDHAVGKTDGPLGQEVRHMTEGQILAVQPFEGTATIREILETHLWMIEEHEATGAKAAGVGSPQRDALASSLPLHGETQMGGSKCTSYCDVATVCGALVRKYGRPEQMVVPYDPDEPPAITEQDVVNEAQGDR